ncbi:polyprotein [Phytophthora megakarya]|uniref:Polyprotein n=1 Tax=Phytophthora megakarya TaxID=4795 RepID=A0A225WHX8_9STRA|nr:polyprotein [Phytophthora megakarya]
MIRRLREFKMDDGSTMARHLDKVDELIVGLQTRGDPLNDSRQLVNLLGSLPGEYESIAPIMKNSKDVTLIEAKEKLLMEYERQEEKVSSERALKATSFGGKDNNGKFDKVRNRYDRKGNGSQRLAEFTGKDFGCGHVCHSKRECPEKANGGSHVASVFAAGEDPSTRDAFDNRGRKENSGSLDGGKRIDGKSIRIVKVLHIPGLDRRLLSVGKLADRGMSVEFQRNSCVIWNESKAIASGKKYGKAYVLACHQDTAYYIEYAGVDSEWELWDARMRHFNEDSLEKTQQVTTGMPKTRPTVKTLCGGCLKGKQTVTHFLPWS